MISKELLEILACPETKETLSIAEDSLVSKINERIDKRDLNNRNNQTITQKIDSGLLRADKKYLYPIRDDIPIMLINEAIPMDNL